MFSIKYRLIFNMYYTVVRRVCSFLSMCTSWILFQSRLWRKECHQDICINFHVPSATFDLNKIWAVLFLAQHILALFFFTFSHLLFLFLLFLLLLFCFFFFFYLTVWLYLFSILGSLLYTIPHSDEWIQGSCHFGKHEQLNTLTSILLLLARLINLSWIIFL